MTRITQEHDATIEKWVLKDFKFRKKNPHEDCRYFDEIYNFFFWTRS